MTLRLHCPSWPGLLRSFGTAAIIAALSLALCGTSVFARPRTWADQDARPVRTPSWMPLAVGDRTPHPAVARVTAMDGNTLSQGSGTLVEVRGQRGLVVTNWHVIRDATGSIVVTFPDGFRSAATVLKVDTDWDLAALLIWRPNATPIAISAAAPRPGDPLTITGYGAGNYRAITGRCTQYVAPGAQFPYEMIEVSVEARQGDSGGPILNERGELAGVLFGAAGGTTSGSFCGRVRWFLDTAWPVEQDQLADTLVSVPTHQPATNWSSGSFLPQPRVPMPPVHSVMEPTPNYSIGTTLDPTTVLTNQAPQTTIGINLNEFVGSSPVERAKAVLAAIGILAVCLQVVRVVRVSPTKNGGKR